MTPWAPAQVTNGHPNDGSEVKAGVQPRSHGQRVEKMNRKDSTVANNNNKIIIKKPAYFIFFGDFVLFYFITLFYFNILFIFIIVFHFVLFQFRYFI